MLTIVSVLTDTLGVAVRLRRREQIRRTLRTLRATVGLSQLAVARKIGVPERRYWQIENGYEDPTDTEISKLAKLLKVEEVALPWPAFAKAS